MLCKITKYALITLSLYNTYQAIFKFVLFKSYLRFCRTASFKYYIMPIQLFFEVMFSVLTMYVSIAPIYYRSIPGWLARAMMYSVKVHLPALAG